MLSGGPALLVNHKVPNRQWQLNGFTLYMLLNEHDKKQYIQNITDDIFHKGKLNWPCIGIWYVGTKNINTKKKISNGIKY